MYITFIISVISSMGGRYEFVQLYIFVEVCIDCLF
jgi:hypothetical protein